MKQYKNVRGSQAQTPMAVDTLSSPTTVYLRKNIRREEGEWIYDELQLTRSEYEIYPMQWVVGEEILSSLPLSVVAEMVEQEYEKRMDRLGLEVSK